MKILLIKMSSLGDIIHTLPALTDAMQHIPNLEVDWVVEEAFAEIPLWHPAVKRVIPIALRRWRKHCFNPQTIKEWKNFYAALRATSYDYVIDAQGLVKSALITRLSRGLRCGLDKQSAWEPLACFAYQRHHSVAPMQHAVVRVRELFSRVFQYDLPNTRANYHIDIRRLQPVTLPTTPYVIFLHGTTWATKHWPENYWIDLAKTVNAAGYAVLLPWGNIAEKERAERIATHASHVIVLPKMKLAELATLLAHATAAVAVDTGLGHLAAALATPTVSLYGPTNPSLTGTHGDHQHHLSATFSCAPCQKPQCTYRGASEEKPACFTQLAPIQVWKTLQTLLDKKSIQNK